MLSIFRSLAFTMVFALLLAGCWKQRDVVTIKSDGSTSFETEVIVTEKGFSVKDIEELTSQFMLELKAAGWQVDKKWVSKSEPFKISFLGRGNIRQIKSAPSFYKIEKLSESTYRIWFVPADAKGGRSTRSMKFERGLLDRGAKVVDERGNEVREIENVLSSQAYKIVF